MSELPTPEDMVPVLYFNITVTRKDNSRDSMVLAYVSKMKRDTNVSNILQAMHEKQSLLDCGLPNAYESTLGDWRIKMVPPSPGDE